MQTLLANVMEALKRARDTAMGQTYSARPMENAKFSEIAQDLDFAITQIEDGEESPAGSRKTYFLREDLDAEWREVTVSEYCQAERDTGFHPKGMSPQDPAYLTTPATASFGTLGGVEGRVEYNS